MSQSNLDIVRGIYAAWPKGLDAFMEKLAPDIEWRFPTISSMARSIR